MVYVTISLLKKDSNGEHKDKTGNVRTNVTLRRVRTTVDAVEKQ